MDFVVVKSSTDVLVPAMYVPPEELQLHSAASTFWEGEI